jgi:hypothetical protein
VFNGTFAANPETPARHRSNEQWIVEDVIERWTRLFSISPLVKRWQQGDCSLAGAEQAKRIVERWRRRLCDVSCYMRCLNEHLAQRANAEDGCAGRFWEGRFRSQALLDENGRSGSRGFGLNQAKQLYRSLLT